METIVYLAGWLAMIAASLKMNENHKLKKEIKELRKKLGKEN